MHVCVTAGQNEEKGKEKHWFDSYFSHLKLHKELVFCGRLL